MQMGAGGCTTFLAGKIRKNNQAGGGFLRCGSGMGPDPEPDPESGPDFLASDLNIRTGFRTGHFPVPDRTGFLHYFQDILTFIDNFWT